MFLNNDMSSSSSPSQFIKDSFAQEPNMLKRQIWRLRLRQALFAPQDMSFSPKCPGEKIKNWSHNLWVAEVPATLSALKVGTVVFWGKAQL